MSLLSSSQKRNIRDVIQTVTDTFMVTPIRYHIAGESLDEFNEDRVDQQFFTIDLKGLVEHGLKENFIQENLQGSRDLHHVKVTFNLEDLEKLSLITSDYKFISNPTKDYFTLKGLLYKVLDMYYDGPLDEKDVLVIVEAERSTESIVTINTITTGNQIPVDEITSGNLNQQVADLREQVEELHDEDHIAFDPLPELPEE